MQGRVMCSTYSYKHTPLSGINMNQYILVSKQISLNVHTPKQTRNDAPAPMQPLRNYPLSWQAYTLSVRYIINDKHIKNSK